ncbi:MAG: hypothetical protein KGK09_11030, partial [Burkholderiales bacterium]|nr:hypothetical protein [Burkholderiales bacterium]
MDDDADDPASPTHGAVRRPQRAGAARWALLAAGLAALGGLLAGCESTPTVAAPVEARTLSSPGSGP